jgi:cytochrome P450
MTQGTDTVFSFNPFSSVSQHDPKRLAFFRQAEPLIPLYPRQGDRPGIYMAMDLELIDIVLRGEAFVVSPSDMRLRRVRQLQLPRLGLYMSTLPFLLEGEPHEKAHQMYYTVTRESYSRTALQLIDGCLAEEVRRFKRACIAQTVDDHGVFDGPEVDLARMFNLWMTRIILKLVGIPTCYAADMIRTLREVIAPLEHSFYTTAERTDMIRSIKQVVAPADATDADELFFQGEIAANHLFTICDSYLETEEMKHGVCASFLQMYAQGEMDRETLLATIVGFLSVAAENPPGSVVALVKGLTRYPEQLQLLRENPSLLNKAADEAFRWFTNVGFIIREVRTPCTLGLTQLSPGDLVACIVEAVHQNPTLHPQPENFIIERKQRQIRVFGGGHWACTGQRLVRELVARAGKQLLLDERPVFTFSPDEEYGSNSFFRAPLHLYAKCVFPT